MRHSCWQYPAGTVMIMVVALLGTLVLCMPFRSQALSPSVMAISRRQQQQQRLQGRKLPARDDTDSISSGQSTEQGSNSGGDFDGSDSDTVGPLRRRILPFTLSLSPIASKPTYQQQIGVRNAVESFLESYLMNATSATTTKSAIVSYVGLTQIVESNHDATHRIAQVTLEGMVYFVDGSTNIPSEIELAILLTIDPPQQEQNPALSYEALVQALSPYFPTLLTVAIHSAEATTTLMPTFPPTTVPRTAAPTMASPTALPPTILPPTASPTTPFPTTLPPTTLTPTASPTTPSPTTLPPTMLPPTVSPTTASPTTLSATTLSPTTLTPTSQPTEEVMTNRPSFVTAYPTTAATTTTATTSPIAATTTTLAPATAIPSTSPTEQPVVVVVSTPPSQPPSFNAPAATTGPTSSPIFPASNVIQDQQLQDANDDDDDSVNVYILIGCALAGFFILVMSAVVLVKVGKWRRRHRHHRPRLSIADEKMSLAGNQKRSDDDDNDYNNAAEQLVAMNIAKMINLEDKEVLSGFIQDGDSRETASWGSLRTGDVVVVAGRGGGNSSNRSGKRNDHDKSKGVSQQEDLESGKTADNNTKNCKAAAMPKSPSEVSGSRRRTTKDFELATRMAGGASTASNWMSYFHKPCASKKEAEEVDLLSTSPPELTRDLGSASVGSTSGVGTDGTLSDFEDAVSIEPDIVTHKTIELFEQMYVVKKDMLESPATAMIPANNTSKNNTNSKKGPEKERPTTPAELTLSKSEAEEERLKDEVMMPNPYVRRPFTGSHPPVDRSSGCALQPTDTSAATLAQRNNEDSDPPPTTGSGRMVPRMSSPKSWWRYSSPSGNEDKASAKGKKNSSAAAAATVGNESEDESTAFGPTPSDGWDPTDSELGSMGPSPNEEEMFKPKVENKTEQSLLNSSVKNASAKAQRRRFLPPGSSENLPPRPAAKNKNTTKKSRMKTTGGVGSSEYGDGELHGAESVNSEDSSSLKLITSSCF